MAVDYMDAMDYTELDARLIAGTYFALGIRSTVNIHQTATRRLTWRAAEALSWLLRNQMIVIIQQEDPSVVGTTTYRGTAECVTMFRWITSNYNNPILQDTLQSLHLMEDI